LYLQKLDASTIKDNFRAFLKTQDEFTDYDMTQSGMDSLLTTFAYAIHYDAYQANSSNAEMFLSSAQLRKNVTGRAKMLKYLPKSRTSAVSIINVIVDERDGQTLPTTLFMPKGTVFAVSANLTKTYYFSTRESYTASKVGTTFIFEDVKVYEGLYSNAYQKYENGFISTIPDPNIDTSSVEVFVQEDPNSSVFQDYEKVDSILNLRGTDRVFYLEENFDELYGIYFGDGLLGKKVADNTNVLVTFQTCSGLDGNDLSGFSFVKSPSKTDPINSGRVTTFTKASSSGGAERESIDSIKFNAPKYFSTQGVIINEDAANYVVPNLYPDIKSVNLWSGKGVSFGKTYISLNPYEDNLTDERIAEILADLERRRMVVLTSLEYVAPTYLDLEIRLNVFFDGTKSITEIETDLYERILAYSKNNIEDYKKSFISSKFITEITPTLLGYDFSLGVISRQTVYPNSLESYGFNFYNEIKTLVSNDFTFQGSTSSLISDGSTLKIISDTGSVKRTNAGSIDLSTGKGTVQGVNIQAITANTFEIKAEPVRESIFAKENSICRILEGDIKISYEVL